MAKRQLQEVLDELVRVVSGDTTEGRLSDETIKRVRELHDEVEEHVTDAFQNGVYAGQETCE